MKARPPSPGLLACYRPVSADPPARERVRQQDGQPRIKVPDLAARVWRDTLARATGELA